MRDKNKQKAESSTYGWKRLAFKGNKIWVQVDESGDLLAKDGKVTARYQLEQEQEYRIRTENLRPLHTLKDSPKKEGANPSQQPSDSKENQSDTISIAASGVSSGDPGPAGIGIRLHYKQHGKTISRYIGEATRNRAELEAIRTGLASMKRHDQPVRLFTDSGYAYGLLVLGWKPQQDQQLVLQIRQEIKQFDDIRIIKGKAPSDLGQDDSAEQLAADAIRKA